MSKRATILIGFLAFVVGAVVAALGCIAVYSHLMGDLVKASVTTESVMTVTELKSLRANNVTNAVGLLETRLDGDLIGLTSSPYILGEIKNDPIYAKGLKEVRDYRIEYPHKSGNAELDADVTKALKLLDRQTNK